MMSSPNKEDSANYVVTLDQAEASIHSIVGGKGANLGILSKQGYNVPPAFVVTTSAYSQFLQMSGLRDKIGSLLGEVDFSDIAVLEAKTAEIRELLEATAVPAKLIAVIEQSYRDLGDGSYVAVRSSGTAEDLAGTSFAGLHDTYLDVLGAEEVVDATKRCWASLWTARAVGYRQRNGFDHFESLLAVVVQKMVSSDVAGVMFTGNPRTAANDETLINATWGLGETLVQGIITPDEFVVKSGTLQILESILGSKELEIVRNPETGRGVITRDVADDRRKLSSLTETEIKELTKLGRKITAQYDGWPQDIEWAIEDSKLYLLQSRPVTGVDFSWDCDVDAWQKAPEDNFDTRTRAAADEFWTGAISPLHYSWTCWAWEGTFYGQAELFGRNDLKQRRFMKYHRAYAYWDCEFERELMCKSVLPYSRSQSLERLPESWRAEAEAAPFSIFDYLKQQARILTMAPELGPLAWFKTMQNYFDNRVEEAEGMSDAEMADLSDQELDRYISKRHEFEWEYNRDIGATGLLSYFRDSMNALAWITKNWYTGKNSNIFVDLLTGTPNPTATLREHMDLARLAELIRDSKQVMTDFKAYPGGAFFEQLQKTEEGRGFAKEIEGFLKRTGHRGQSDRDICFERYIDSPDVLYNALEVHSRSHDDPMEMCKSNDRVREVAFDDVVQNLERKSLGFLKIEAFKFLHEYILKAIELRDDEREYIDKYIYAIKRSYVEVNNRLKERGIFDDDFDFYMLTHQELFSVLHGTANLTLIRHKVAGRRKNWEMLHRKEVELPKFLHRNSGVVEEAKTGYNSEGQLVISGSGTSRGEIVAIARIVKNLDQISRVNKGEILITNSTDPGWTPVFALLSGVVVETGGILSHSGCLAREYGFPAAQIERAMSVVPDGALVRLNGETGMLTIIEIPLNDEEPLPAADVAT
jgi:rifampicin phosphotransferase